MITGLDWSSWSTVTDAKAMFNDREIVDVAYIRAWDGFRDDQEFDNRLTVSYRKMLEQSSTTHGSVLWGPYMYLGYSAQVGSLTWKAANGKDQAANCWAMTTAGGRTFQLPVALDVERNAFMDDNLVRQVVPLPSVDVYCQTYLVPAIEYLTAAMGRRPVLYSNPDVILNYLAPLLPKYPQITECPLWVASYSNGSQPSYWDRISKHWPKWLMWQNAGDVKDWPGISDVDHVKCQGTRAAWKAWANDAKMPLPQDGAPDPTPTPDPMPTPTPDPIPTHDLVALTARVSALEIAVSKLTTITQAVTAWAKTDHSLK